MERLVLVAGLVLLSAARAPAVDVGQMAPLFEAESTQGKIRLEEYFGTRNVLLAFYYKDFTGG